MATWNTWFAKSSSTQRDGRTQLAAAAPTAADTAADTDTDSDADSDSPEADAPEATFATFGLHPFLNAGLRRMGYRVPPIGLPWAACA